VSLKKSLLFTFSFIFLLGLAMSGCAQDLDLEEDAISSNTAENNDADASADNGEAENNEPENGSGNEASRTDQPLQIATSFSVLNDIVQQVVGDRGDVDYIVPIGEEPHEYEPIPSDFQKVEDADIFFTNGLDLEEWIDTMMGNVTDTPSIEVSTGVAPIPLEGEDGNDPHAWLDPQRVIQYVENIRQELTEIDPDGAEEYEQNANAYIEELEDLNNWIQQQIEQIPEENRTIVISENAFKYFGEAYGFDTVGIWEINSHEEGTPQQISTVVDLVKDQGIPALFVETTVDRRYMETLSTETGVDIAGEVYTDAIDEEGTEADSYINMIKYNVEKFTEGLGR
jgi:manganese transport system substrate-binding protein